MRLSIFGLLLTAIVALSSCADKLSSDEILIDNIQNATNRQAVERPELPTSCQNLLETEHLGEALSEGWLATGLGYELQIGEGCNRYFDLDGRELQERRRRGRPNRPGHGGPRCFEVMFPVTVTFDSGTTMTINSREEIRQAISEHCSDWEHGTRCFEVEFPLTVQFEDGSTDTAENQEDLRAFHENCDRG